MSLSRSGHAVQVIGHLGRDPETRFTPSGQQVCNFSLASNRKWKDEQGNEHEEKVWWRVAAWGKLAEVCQQFLVKGRQVLVEGHLKPDDSGNPRVYQKNDGTSGAAYELTAADIRFLGSKSDGGNGVAAAPAGDPGANAPVEDDSIPF